MAILTSTAPTTATDLSLPRLHLMRGGYLLMGVGLALVKWPLLPDAHTQPLYEGLTLCLLVAMSLLAFLGLPLPGQAAASTALRVGLEAPLALPGRTAQGPRRKPRRGDDRHRAQLLACRPHPRCRPVAVRGAQLPPDHRRPVAMRRLMPHRPAAFIRTLPALSV